MGQVIDLCFEHITFGWLQFETMLTKVVKNYTHPFQMFFFCLREDYYIIKVDEVISEIQFTQAICMSLWKVGGALHNPNGILSHS